jgi:hypothetical protein
VPGVTDPVGRSGYAGAGRIDEMSSDLLVLGAMVVTIVATIWWALTPVSTDAQDRTWLTDDALDADAA